MSARTKLPLIQLEAGCGLSKGHAGSLLPPPGPQQVAKRAPGGGNRRTDLDVPERGQAGTQSVGLRCLLLCAQRVASFILREFRSACHEGLSFWRPRLVAIQVHGAPAPLKLCRNQVLWIATPNVRAKRAPAAWRAGQQAQNGPQAQRLMASVTCRWRSA